MTSEELYDLLDNHDLRYKVIQSSDGTRTLRIEVNDESA